MFWRGILEMEDTTPHIELVFPLSLFEIVLSSKDGTDTHLNWTLEMPIYHSRIVPH